MFAKALAAAYQLPFYSVPIQKGTEEGTFQGLLKARDGKFEFCSTDFLNAFKNGGVIVLEELNLADPAILSGAIGQAVEAPYMIMEDELRPVYRHPLCIIIGTFNVGTAGSKEINPMLSSRFYQTYLVDDPSEDEFVERLMKFDCDKKTAKKVYNAYSRILDYLKSPDVSALEYCKNVTFRGCVGAIQCLQEGSTLKEAIEDTLVGKIAEYDLDLANDVLHTVVEVLPD
jgi:MoxR-like ATPase